MNELQPKTIEEMIMANNAYIQSIFGQITQMHVEILLLCHKILPESIGRNSDDWANMVQDQADSTTARNYRRVMTLYNYLKKNHAK